MPRENQVIVIILAFLTCFYMVLSFGAHIHERTKGRWAKFEAICLLILAPIAFVLTWCLIVALSPVLAAIYILHRCDS
jgi:hypothetical protein